MLASLLFPYDEDVPALIDGWLSQLEENKQIRRYAVGGQIYLEVAKFSIHQKIDRPTKSKLPSPRESSRKVALDLGRDLVSNTRRSRAALSVSELIYQAYPKHAAKAAALKAIDKAIRKISPGHDADWLLERVRAYAEQRRNEDPQFTPYPATWFNRGSYDDESLTPKPKTEWVTTDGSPLPGRLI